jgi:hypothetical protein
MVPYSAHSEKAYLDLFVDLSLILWGLLLTVSTVLNCKKHRYAPIFFRIIFWSELSIIFLGTAVLVVTQSLRTSFAEYYFQVAGVLMVFYIPMILLYVNRNFQNNGKISYE